MKQRAAESAFGIGIELVALNKQPVRVGSAQSEDDAHTAVAAFCEGLRAGGYVRDVEDDNRTFVGREVYGVFAYSLTADGPNETIVETRIRPNGRTPATKQPLAQYNVAA